MVTTDKSLFHHLKNVTPSSSCIVVCVKRIFLNKMMRFIALLVSPLVAVAAIEGKGDVIVPSGHHTSLKKSPAAAAADVEDHKRWNAIDEHKA